LRGTLKRAGSLVDFRCRDRFGARPRRRTRRCRMPRGRTRRASRPPRWLCFISLISAPRTSNADSRPEPTAPWVGDYAEFGMRGSARLAKSRNEDAAVSASHTSKVHPIGRKVSLVKAAARKAPGKPRIPARRREWRQRTRGAPPARQLARPRAD
jgi:hypothetical protein